MPVLCWVRITGSDIQIKGTRFTDKYLSAKYQPSRATSSVPPAFSPVRKRTLETKVFGAAPGTTPQSVFHTAVKSNPFSLAGNTAAFGGMRGGPARGFGDEDDEDDEEVKREASVFSSGAQSLELREDSITYDQVYINFPFYPSDMLISCLTGKAHSDAERLENS